LTCAVPSAIRKIAPLWICKSYQGKTIVVQKGLYIVGAVGFEKDTDGEQRLAQLMKEVR